MYYLIKLLEEAKEGLMDMLKVADDSVADYALQLEIAIRFINKALDTEDRLDVFRALQKALDAFQVEVSADPFNDGYKDLVERIKQALEGLGECTKIKKSELKSIIKLILEDVYKSPEGEDELKRGILKRLHDALSGLKPDNLRYPFEGQNKAHELLNNISENSKEIILSFIKSDKNLYNKLIKSFDKNTKDFLVHVTNWALNIGNKDVTRRDEVNEILREINDHIYQINNLIKWIMDSIKKYRNYINAYKQVEHLNEIFRKVSMSVDLLFGQYKKDHEKI